MKNIFKDFKIVDLTHPLDRSVPTWTGSCGFQYEIKMDYDQGLRVMSYKCHGGIGTHIDAPSHFIPGGASIADIPIDELLVPVRVLDLSSKMHADSFVMPEDILDHENEWGTIEPGSAFFVYTGWDKFWKQQEKYRNPDSSGQLHFPGYHVKAAELLLQRGIVGIGMDTLSPDGSDNGPGSTYPVHHCILGAKKYILENVAHLSEMPPSGAYVISLPLRIVDGTESAVRLIGLVPK